MNYKNGYKVVYEIVADGKKTFYASKSAVYPNRNENGAIIDDVVAEFDYAEFTGKTIYEYKGEFYVSEGALPAYNEDGTPKDSKIDGFEKLFVEETPATEEPAAYTRRTRKATPVVEEPVVEEPVTEEPPVTEE